MNTQEKWEKAFDKQFRDVLFVAMLASGDKDIILNVLSKDIKSFIRQQKDISYKQGKKDAEFDLDKLAKMTIANETRQEVLEEVRKKIEKLPNNFPELESDDYDQGYQQAKQDLLSALDLEK